MPSEQSIRTFRLSVSLHPSIEDTPVTFVDYYSFEDSSRQTCPPVANRKHYLLLIRNIGTLVPGWQDKKPRGR
jgi:hypothetical protein